MEVSNELIEELKKLKVQDYEIHDLVISRIKSEVSRECGVYVEKITDDMVKSTIKESVEGIKNRLISAYDSLENAKLFYEFKYNHNWISLTEYSDAGITFHIREYGAANLISLLRYAKNGVFDKSYAEAHAFMAENKIQSTPGKTFFMMENISVTCYKNGKVTVHGLSKEVVNRIVDGYKIVEKYRNRSL